MTTREVLRKTAAALTQCFSSPGDDLVSEIEPLLQSMDVKDEDLGWSTSSKGNA